MTNKAINHKLCAYLSINLSASSLKALSIWNTIFLLWNVTSYETSLIIFIIYAKCRPCASIILF